MCRASVLLISCRTNIDAFDRVSSSRSPFVLLRALDPSSSRTTVSRTFTVAMYHADLPIISCRTVSTHSLALSLSPEFVRSSRYRISTHHGESYPCFVSCWRLIALFPPRRSFVHPNSLNPSLNTFDSTTTNWFCVILEDSDSAVRCVSRFIKFESAIHVCV